VDKIRKEQEMKIIGRNLSGGVLLEMALEEYAALQASARALSGLPELVVSGQIKTPVKANKPIEPKLVVAARKVATAPTQKRVCLTCFKPMDKSYSPAAKTHKGTCKQLYARKYAREHYREKYGKSVPASPAIAPVNLADPLLTNEQRMAARLEMIKRSAEKIG
jgi:hypothetical protein